MADFDVLNPKKSITDPEGRGVPAEFPRHVHKWAGAHQINDYRHVTTQAELDAALAEGYSLTPQLSAPVVPDAGDEGDAEKAPKAPKAPKSPKAPKADA